MKNFCEKCMKIHSEGEICPIDLKALSGNSQLLTEAATFTSIAAQYRLISSQDLENAANKINQVVGTNLSFEGTQQFARDIEVFKRLNEEAFKNAGVFRTSEVAQEYLKTLNGNNKYLDIKLTGYSQEVDWIRMKMGQISRLWDKSSILNNNAPGVDGVTVNRLTGNQVSRTTIKATTVDPQNSINKVKESIEAGHTNSKDVIFGVKGTEDVARKNGLTNPVKEKNTMQDVTNSNDRLRSKMANGKATTYIPAEEVAKKMASGAIIGAAVGLTVSSMSCYLKYRNGEITIEEAFKNIGEDTTKGALTGSAMAGITLFLPGGVIGFVGGMAIGIYLNKTLVNILDEVYGKGAYKQILISSGYVMGMSENLVDCITRIKEDERQIQQNILISKQMIKNTNNKLSEFDSIMEEL